MRIVLRASLFASALLVAGMSSPIAAQTIGSGTPDNAVGQFGRDALTPGTTQTVAQTFSTSAAAPLLQSFTFYLSDYFGGSGLLVQASIFEFALDHLVGPAIFTSAVQSGSSNIFGYDAVQFNDVNVLLTPGTMYALLLRPTTTSPDGSTNFVGTTTGDTFGAGQLFTSASSLDAELASAGAFTASDASTFGADAAVQMTFSVAPVTATPEPATLTLLATGFAGLGAAVRRRRGAR